MTVDKKRDFIKPINKKLDNKDLDILNKNILIMIKQLNKINIHLSRIDYDIGVIKNRSYKKGEIKGEIK